MVVLNLIVLRDVLPYHSLPRGDQSVSWKSRSAAECTGGGHGSSTATTMVPENKERHIYNACVTKETFYAAAAKYPHLIIISVRYASTTTTAAGDRAVPS